MTGTTLDVRRFRNSLSRAVASVDFYRRFYDRLIAGSPETASLFQGRDLSRIQSKLKMTLDMVNDNAGAQAGLGMYLELLGRIHVGMNITEAQLHAWREAALATAAESDPQFDAATRAAWEGVLDDLVAKMGFGQPDGEGPSPG